jgi:hypothetical protein
MPEGISRHAVEVGVFAGIGNLIIFNHFLPPIADIRQAEPMDGDIEKSERTALLVCTAWTVLVSAFTGKLETFAIAGLALVGADFAFKHANAVYPSTGTVQAPGGMDQQPNLSPLPDYTEGTG